MTIAQIKKYAKAVVAVAGGVAIVATAIAAPDATPLTVVEAILLAFGVYKVPNS